MARRLTMAQQVKRGLVAYWPLATAGAVDLKSAFYDGRGPYDLTNNNTVTRAAGPSNNLRDAAAFVGASSQSLSVADNTSFVIGNHPFTVGIWASVTALTATQMLITQSKGSTNDASWELQYNTSNDLFQFILSTTGAARAGVAATLFGTPTINTFYFVVGRWYPGVAKITINADHAKTDSSSVGAVAGPLFNSTEPIVIGAWGDGAFLTGSAAHAFLAKRYMADEEITWLYNNGAGRDLVRGV